MDIEEKRKKQREYYHKNKNRIKLHRMKYLSNNKEKIKVKKKEYDSRPEVKERKKKHYKENKEEILRKNKEWTINNKEKSKIIKKRYEDKNREKRKKYFKGYGKKNRKKLLHKCRLRNARKLNQIPYWADLEKIKQFYIDCPKGYDVDHIIPLSKNGWHCVENFQYLKSRDNQSKGDKMPESISMDLAIVIHKLNMGEISLK